MDVPEHARHSLVTLSFRLTQAAAFCFPLLDGEGDPEFRAALDQLRGEIIGLAERIDKLADTGTEGGGT